MEIIYKTCKTCKYYTNKNGIYKSKNHKYCNRLITIKMLPDDYCSRWEYKDGDKNGKD